MIGLYTQVTEFTNTGAGTSEWCSAEKDGVRYFMKKFQAPVYPSEDAGLSAKRYEARMKRFHRFVDGLKAMYKALRENDTSGILVVPEEVFIYQYHICTASEFVEGNISHDQVCRLSDWQKAVILRTLTRSLMDVHRSGYVHSDMKPDNIIFTQDQEGNCRIRLIDFDGAFLRDEPPKSSEEVHGDPAFFAPELYAFSMGEEVVPDEKIDIFALGVIFHYLWSGRLPVMEAGKTMGEQVLSGKGFGLVPEIPLSLRKMIMRMLRREPSERPTCEEIYEMTGSFAQEFPVEKIKLIPDEPVSAWKDAEPVPGVEPAPAPDPAGTGYGETKNAVVKIVAVDESWNEIESHERTVTAGMSHSFFPKDIDGYRLFDASVKNVFVDADDKDSLRVEFRYKKKPETEKSRKTRYLLLALVAVALLLYGLFLMNLSDALHAGWRSDYGEAARIMRNSPGLTEFYPDLYDTLMKLDKMSP